MTASMGDETSGGGDRAGAEFAKSHHVETPIITRRALKVTGHEQITSYIQDELFLLLPTSCRVLSSSSLCLVSTGLS